jgi:hypothetical protein
MTQRLIFSYAENEYLPIFTSIGHNLKEENLCNCTIDTILQNGLYKIIHLKTNYKNKEIELNITMKRDDNYYYFTRGFLYVDNKEIPVTDYKCYQSLQIEKYCYDNLNVARIPNNIFEK